jgi:SAM-dependent methyltransferase
MTRTSHLAHLVHGAAAMPQAIADALRSRKRLTDPSFDRVYPAQQRFRSWLHWTPLEVAVRASAMLASGQAIRVLDVGSGVGKLCLVGALTTPATWFGIERDAAMVTAARAAALKLQVEKKAVFTLGDVTRTDWSGFDAFYLFNPFGEYLLHGLDGAVSRRDAYRSCIDFTQQQLAAAPPGTRVVTYHGFGGSLPSGYELVHREPAHEDELMLWVRRASRRRSSDRLESQ